MASEPTKKELKEWPEVVVSIYEHLASVAELPELDKDESEQFTKRRDQFVKHVREQMDEEAPAPATPYDTYKWMAESLKFELESLEQELDVYDEKKKETRERIKVLEKDIRAAKRKSKPFKARIKTLPRKWQKHWIVTYDGHRESGKSKSESSALAWAQVKVHCTRLKPGTWSCPEWEKTFKKTAKETSETKKALEKARQKSEKLLKKIEKRKGSSLG